MKPEIPGRRGSVSFVAVNAEQAEAWNGSSGRHFIEQRERHERMRGRLTARLLAGAQVQHGENVLDIGCGCGDVTILRQGPVKHQAYPAICPGPCVSVAGAAPPGDGEPDALRR